MARITVGSVDDALKTSYWQWCIENGISMSEPLRFFMRTLAYRHKTWKEIRLMLARIERAEDR